MYAISFWTNSLLPRFLPKYTVETFSKMCTIAFSNTPGPIKPFFYYNSAGGAIRCISSQNYMLVMGKLGLNLACMSFCNSFKITVTSDSNVFSYKEARQLVNLIEDNIVNEIKKNNISLEDDKKTK